jgi:hypothetical protein
MSAFAKRKRSQLTSREQYKFDMLTICCSVKFSIFPPPPSLYGGVRLSPLGTSATIWHTVPAKMHDDECGTTSGTLGRGNRSTGRKPTPVPLFAPQIPNGLTQDRTFPPGWEAGDEPDEL